MKYLLLLLPFFFLACGNPGDIPLDEAGNEKFESFHEKFYTDSSFQLVRIEFPMIKPPKDKTEERVFWTEDEWEILKKIDVEDSNIDRQIYDMDGLVQEKIIVQKRFMIKLQYSLINQKWFLTSYSGIRDIGFFIKNKAY